MSPKLVNKEQKTKEITICALKLFSQKGYAATGMEHIAAKAGIGKSTIYEYFSAKEDLFLAAIKEWIALIDSELLSVLDDIENPVDQLRTFFKIGIEFFDRKNPDTTRLFIEILQQTTMEEGIFFSKRYLIKEIIDGSRQIVINILLDGVSKGIFRPEIARDVEKIAINLLAYFDGINLHKMVIGNFIDIDGQVNRYVEDIVNQIINPDIRHNNTNIIKE